MYSTCSLKFTEDQDVIHNCSLNDKSYKLIFFTLWASWAYLQPSNMKKLTATHDLAIVRFWCMLAGDLHNWIDANYFVTIERVSPLQNRRVEILEEDWPLAFCKVVWYDRPANFLQILSTCRQLHIATFIISKTARSLMLVRIVKMTRWQDCMIIITI